MRAIDDVELDPVRVDILALILLLRLRFDLTVFHLTAVGKAFRDILGLVRVMRPTLFRARGGLVDVIRENGDAHLFVCNREKVCVPIFPSSER